MNLNKLIQAAITAFDAQTTSLEPSGKTSAYSIFHAAADAVRQHANSLQAAAALCVEAGKRKDVKVSELDLGRAEDSSSVLEYLQVLLEEIVTKRLTSLPDIRRKDILRARKYE